MNESLHLIMLITFSYLSSYFLDIFSAICLWYIEHSFAITPLTEKTNGVNVPCSTSMMRLLYSLFFSFSCFDRIFSVDIWRCDNALVFVILTTKKAFCPSRQIPRALTSGRALSPAIPFTISPSIGCNDGSTSTSEWSLHKRLAS